MGQSKYVDTHTQLCLLGAIIAATATTPVLSPIPIGDHLSKKELFIERSALQGLEEIGEGMHTYMV